MFYNSALYHGANHGWSFALFTLLRKFLKNKTQSSGMVTPVTEVSDEDIVYIFWVKHSKNSTAILTVTVEVKRSSETSVTLQKSAICNNTEDSNLHQYRFKNHKSCLFRYFPCDSHKNNKLVQTNPSKYFKNM